MFVYLCAATLTLALQTGTAGRVTVANYTQIIWAFIWGLIFLGEKPMLTSLIGTLLIAVDAGCAVYKAWIKNPGKKNGAGTKATEYDSEFDEVEIIDVADTPELQHDTPELTVEVDEPAHDPKTV